MQRMRSRLVPVLAAGLILLAAGVPHARAQAAPLPPGEARPAATDSPESPRTLRTVRIGVLAYRGNRSARQRWTPLVRYLSAAVPGVRFLLQPVTLASAAPQLESGRIDYLVTNPGHYVSLAERIPLAPIATLERLPGRDRPGLVHFGSVIFVRADSDIATLADLRGRRLTAVAPDAFGGFLMAWAEFVAEGLDPFRDLGALRFAGFPQDAIVEAVLSGRTDAGVVRTGLLESLAAEGRIRLADLRILHAGRYPGWPLGVSTRLQPEWPFLARKGTDRRITVAIARALLATQDAELRRRLGLRSAWTAPLSYDGVRRLVRAYETARDRRRDAAEIPRFASGLPVILAVMALAAALWTLALRTWRTAPRPHPRPAADMGTADLPEDAVDCFHRLTPREHEVLSLLCQGKSTKAIARELSISPKTVEYHRANLLKKTGMKSATSLVCLATRLGFDRMRARAEHA